MHQVHRHHGGEDTNGQWLGDPLALFVLVCVYQIHQYENMNVYVPSAFFESLPQRAKHVLHIHLPTNHEMILCKPITSFADILSQLGRSYCICMTVDNTMTIVLSVVELPSALCQLLLAETIDGRNQICVTLHFTTFELNAELPLSVKLVPTLLLILQGWSGDTSIQSGQLKTAYFRCESVNVNLC